MEYKLKAIAELTVEDIGIEGQSKLLYSKVKLVLPEGWDESKYKTPTGYTEVGVNALAHCFTQGLTALIHSMGDENPEEEQKEIDRIVSEIKRGLRAVRFEKDK